MIESTDHSGTDAATAAAGSAPQDEPLQAVAGQMGGGEADTGQFQTVEDAQILCLTCRERFGADVQRADEIERVEGASDPADQSMLVSVRCPNCGATGTLVLRYGPEASAEEAELVVTLGRTPSETGRGAVAPGDDQGTAVVEGGE